MPTAKFTCHSKQPCIRLPCSPALAARPGWLQMDGLGAGQEQAEELGARGFFTPLWDSSQAERARDACMLLQGQSHSGRQVPTFCLQPHLCPSRLGSSRDQCCRVSPGTLTARWLGHGCFLQTELQHHTHPLNSLFIWHMPPSSLKSSSVLVAGSISQARHTPIMSPVKWPKQGTASPGVQGGHTVDSQCHAACSPVGREGEGGLLSIAPR